MTLAELLKQKADIDRQIANAQSESRAKAIADVQQLMSQHGLTAVDIAQAPKKGPKANRDGTRKAVAAKYKDGSGNQWSGRGLKPKWLTAALASGKALTDFAV